MAPATAQPKANRVRVPTRVERWIPTRLAPRADPAEAPEVQAGVAAQAGVVARAAAEDGPAADATAREATAAVPAGIEALGAEVATDREVEAAGNVAAGNVAAAAEDRAAAEAVRDLAAEADAVSAAEAKALAEAEAEAEAEDPRPAAPAVSVEAAVVSTATHKRCLRGRRVGLTLVELMLALGLSVLVMFAISSAIFVHLRMLDAKQTYVEEAQLARAVLRMIADDLRRTIHYRIADLSATEDLISESLSDVPGGDLSAEDGGGIAEPPPMEETEPNTDNLADSETAPVAPGLYGNYSEIMIDISRLPRDDEYPSLQSANAVITDLPSDIKTVTYYIGPDPKAGINPVVAANQGALVGLVRRELDRSVNRLALEGGLASDVLSTAGQLVAPEILAIEFQYYDGFQMLPEWDSTLMEGLPVAVDIRLTIASEAPDETSVDPTSGDPYAGQTINGRLIREGVVYHLLVPLPTAEPTMPVDEEEEGADTEDGSDSDSGSQESPQ